MAKAPRRALVSRVVAREVSREVFREVADPPRWCEDGATFKKFALNKAIKDAWRTGLEVDDLFCEFSLIFAKLLRKYPDVVEPPHMMSLFKRACENRVIDLDRRRHRRKDRRWPTSHSLSQGAWSYTMMETEDLQNLELDLNYVLDAELVDRVVDSTDTSSEESVQLKNLVYDYIRH